MRYFARCARHLPGFGGMASFDALTWEQVELLLDDINEDLDRRNKALKK